ncbi:hypothetical protein NPIL_610631 [Nephila pilipes]|uniref:Uncharacterized protein n=1 Tax=Nephila pilipes TaxID=299642 RepID=A0A8X6QNA3_NEPPI|nr:hypothetical protein NPIL_610631 [Nephila pilipes]
METRVENRFDPETVKLEKVSQGLLRNSERNLKKSDYRMGFIYNNLFIVKCFFIFGLRKVDTGMAHLIQTTSVPVLIYELPPSSRTSRVERNL